MSHVVILVLVLTSLGVHGQEFLVEAHPGVIVLPPQPELLHGEVLADSSPGRAYSFSYDAGDHSRQETSDHLGNVRGSYSVLDPDGVRRRVDYQAGPGMGFVATSAEIPPVVGPDQRTLDILLQTASPRPLGQYSTLAPTRIRSGYITQSPVGSISSVTPLPERVYSPSYRPPITRRRGQANPRGRISYTSSLGPRASVEPNTIVTPQGVLHLRDPLTSESRRGRNYSPTPGPTVSSSSPIPSVAPYGLNGDFGRRLHPLSKPLFTPNHIDGLVFQESTPRAIISSSPREPEISVHGQTGYFPDNRPRHHDTFPGASLTGVVVETPTVRSPLGRGKTKYAPLVSERAGWRDEPSLQDKPQAPAWRAEAARRILTGPEVQYETKAKRAHNVSRMSLGIDKPQSQSKGSHTMKVPRKKPASTSTTTAKTTTTTTTTAVPPIEWAQPSLEEPKNSTLSRSKLESFTILARNGLNSNIHSKFTDDLYISKNLYDKIKKS